MVAGWGRTTGSPRGASSLTLQEAEVTITYSCERSEGQLCASGPAGEGACEVRPLPGTSQGDSGGPLTVEAGGGRVLAGVVNRGPRYCGQVGALTLPPTSGGPARRVPGGGRLHGLAGGDHREAGRPPRLWGLHRPGHHPHPRWGQTAQGERPLLLSHLIHLYSLHVSNQTCSDTRGARHHFMTMERRKCKLSPGLSLQIYNSFEKTAKNVHKSKPLA